MAYQVSNNDFQNSTISSGGTQYVPEPAPLPLSDSVKIVRKEIEDLYCRLDELARTLSLLDSKIENLRKSHDDLDYRVFGAATNANDR